MLVVLIRAGLSEMKEVAHDPATDGEDDHTYNYGDCEKLNSQR